MASLSKQFSIFVWNTQPPKKLEKEIFLNQAFSSETPPDGSAMATGSGSYESLRYFLNG